MLLLGTSLELGKCPVVDPSAWFVVSFFCVSNYHHSECPFVLMPSLLLVFATSPLILVGLGLLERLGLSDRDVSGRLRRRGEMGRVSFVQTYLLGLLLRRGPGFDVDIQVLDERVSLGLPAQDDGRTGALVVGGQADGFEEGVALCAGVVQGRFDAERFLGAFQDVA